MKFWVTVVPVIIRELGGVVVTAYKVQRAFIFAHKIKKGFYPFFICAAADCRSANLKAFVYSLYRSGRNIIKFKIFFHVCIFPEARKVWLVPYFNRPGNNFIGSIAVHKMAQRCLNQAGPALVVIRWCSVPLPVEN